MKNISRGSYGRLSDDWIIAYDKVNKQKDKCINGNRNLADQVIELDRLLRAAEYKKMMSKLQRVHCEHGGIVKDLVSQAKMSPCSVPGVTVGKLHHFGLKIPEISEMVNRQMVRQEYVSMAREILNLDP